MAWVIPLVDNVSGLGKSGFGQEYIRRCKQKWDDLPETKKREGSFLDVVRNCHTITIQFSLSDLLDEKGAFDIRKAERSLVTRIGAYFDDNYSILPRALAPDAFPDPIDILLKKLTREVGPLFIVIDGINMAFNIRKLDDRARSERFVKFCNDIVYQLFSVQKVFFLIAGRASFLSYVGPNPALNWCHAPFSFRRLRLGLLGAPDIEKIIKKTYWDHYKTETIQEHCNLDDGQVIEVAAHLRKAVFGHPRSLLTPPENVPFLRGATWISFS